eukprot:13999044-Alexandrium_andersonii.AAC.1
MCIRDSCFLDLETAAGSSPTRTSSSHGRFADAPPGKGMSSMRIDGSFTTWGGAETRFARQ